MRKPYPLGRSRAVWALGRGRAAWALGRGRAAWALGRSRATWALGDDILPGPDLQREGAAAAVDDGIGAVLQRPELRHGTAATDPDQPGGEELGWQLAGQGQAGTGIVPGQRKSRSI